MKTKILRVKDIKFYKNGREIQKKTCRQSADKVKITFPRDQNGAAEKMESVICFRATENSVLCPVRSWAK